MRPVRLELEGYTAFRRPVTVDFTDANLFALSGPTGAGKTSIIEAMTFALYGAVPRLDDRRAVAPVISQNLTEARVRLDFSVGGTGYTAVRVVRATRAGATTKEARLQRGDQVIAGNADEVSAAVVDLLGLTFEHFTTCVSLPQGQFARFLHDKPRDRQDLLVRLLDLGLYERVASTARQRAVSAAARAELLATQLERLVDATPEALAEATQRVEALSGLVAVLRAARPDIEALEDKMLAARLLATERRQQLDLLRSLHAPDDVGDLAAQLTDAAAERARLLGAEEQAAKAVVDAEAGRDLLPARSHLEAIQRDHARRAELQAAIDATARSLMEATTAAEKLHQAEQEARRRRDLATETLERLRVEHRAHALVPSLREGEPCPVCRQNVRTIPDLALPDLTDAEAALRGTGHDLDEALKALAAADQKAAQVEAGLVDRRSELEEVVRRLTDQPAPDTVGRLLADLAAAETTVADARRAERTARDALSAATRHHERLTERARLARRSFDAARDAVATLGPPPAECVDLAADWRALLSWAEERQPELAAAADEHIRVADESEHSAAGRRAALADACRAVGIEPPPPPTWPGESVAAEHARAEQLVQRITDAMAEADELRTGITTSTGQRQVAEALARHLDAKHFERWLLDEAVERLAAGATVILSELSNHAYSLSIDARTSAFTVIDHTNASQPRSARTLSGGETFLASLSLALALADQVAELAVGGAARLESLFLDEGFGALDAETLDVVATALDELGARGRMVGVVTHVRDLAERLPVRFEVSKSAGVATVTRMDG